MNNNYKSLKSMCEDIGISKGLQQDEYLFTLEMVNIFFFNDNIGKVDIATNFIDGPNDGGIDFIYQSDDKMILIQGKSSSDISLEDAKNAVNKILETIYNFENEIEAGYSDRLIKAYSNAYDMLNDDKNIEIVLFTKTELTDVFIENFKNSCSKNDLSNYNINIYGNKQIEEKKALIYQNSNLIPEGKLQILTGNNRNDVLEFEENGIIVNIKASSLKKMYEKYNKNGLFSYNLREHIRQKNVDTAIDKTIEKEKEKFWFYNNGITIGCNSFIKDGNKIKLESFSIINGAQTTTRIGENKSINSKNDFCLSCKIIKSGMDKTEFIGKISEASNSQKPIKLRDLKSNRNEQKKLQYLCGNNKPHILSIEIKRGVKPKAFKNVDKWQRITNENLGQLILACILQKPGVARNSKSTLFTSTKVYGQVYMRKQDPNTLYDLVRMSHIYDEFINNKISSKDADLDDISLAKNGKLTSLALSIYLYKVKINLINSETLKDLNKDNLSGLLISDYKGDDLDEKLYNLFGFIVKNLKQIYNNKKNDLKITSYSNFFKGDQKYRMIIDYFNKLDSYDKEKIDSFLKVFTEKK